MTFNTSQIAVIAFSALYLLIGGIYFFRDLNLEFVIYVGVIVAVFALLFGTLRITRFPTWLLWLVSFWGLLHILGGAVVTQDGVLFAYRIYPFLDLGGDFYILKYDQVVHAYLYGVMMFVFLHLVKRTLGAKGSFGIMLLVAMMASMGVSALNEIMEFLIAVTLERNGVGGYENAMLDLIFNFTGTAVAALLVSLWGKGRHAASSALPLP
jgi:putative membrane protein